MTEADEFTAPTRARPHPHTFYRIVVTNPPTLADFTSYAARGRVPLSDDPEILCLWDGLSVFATLAQARRKARGAPYLGAYIAELRLPADAAARYERTRGPGHFTLWAAPADALAWVDSVVPVQGPG